MANAKIIFDCWTLSSFSRSWWANHNNVFLWFSLASNSSFDLTEKLIRSVSSKCVFVGDGVGAFFVAAGVGAPLRPVLCLAGRGAGRGLGAGRCLAMAHLWPSAVGCLYMRVNIWLLRRFSLYPETRIHFDPLRHSPQDFLHGLLPE